MVVELRAAAWCSVEAALGEEKGVTVAVGTPTGPGQSASWKSVTVRSHGPDPHSDLAALTQLLFQNVCHFKQGNDLRKLPFIMTTNRSQC